MSDCQSIKTQYFMISKDRYDIISLWHWLTIRELVSFWNSYCLCNIYVIYTGEVLQNMY